MYEINVAALETDSRDFPLARRAILDRYNRLYKDHMPNGPLTRRRDAPQRECVASSYTAIVMSHTQTVAGAFDSGLYASGFALVRPMLEALLKQAMLGEYKGDDDGWKKIPDLRIRVTRANLKALEFRSGWSDILPWWENVKPVLNDFVHGGRGQLTSNPIDENGWPKYPGAWFWSSMLIATMSALITSGWFWAYIGDEERCQRILDAVTKEDWGALTLLDNGQHVRIVGRALSEETGLSR